MKVYIAGRTTDAKRVEEVAERLKNEGHEITFEWWGPDGEIRTDLDPADLDILDIDPGDFSSGVEWMTQIIHVPTDTHAIGKGRSQVQAHDEAMNMLRVELNAGWHADPDRATELALRERDAVMVADAVVLCWATDILGAAIEVGMAMAWEKTIVVLEDERESVFWYLPGVHRARDIDEAVMFLGGKNIAEAA